MTPGGLIGHNGTKTTFAVNASTGAATFGGALDAASGSFGGSVNVGNFTGYAWPTAGLGGAHISASGLLLGNANGGGKYFQIDSGLTTGNAAIYTNIPAYLEDAQVSTLKIAGQAVTIPLSATTAAGIVVGSTAYTTIQQITYVSSGNPVIIHFAHTGTSGRMWTRLIRDDGLTLYSSLNFAAAGSSPFDCAFTNDVPPAGTRTYYVQCAKDNTTTATNTISNRQMALIETKR
jgi:hypothetical protein